MLGLVFACIACFELAPEMAPRESEAVFDGASCAGLATRLIGTALAGGAEERPHPQPLSCLPSTHPPGEGSHLLSFGEHGLWLLDRLLPADDASYRLAAAARLTGPVAAPELRAGGAG